MRRRFSFCIIPVLALAACYGGTAENNAAAPAAEPEARLSPSLPLTAEAQLPSPYQVTEQPAQTKPAPRVEIIGPSRAAPQELPTGRDILPLARILQIAKRAAPGEVIEVELDDADDADDIPEYELKILTPEGRSIELKIDARRGTIIEIEED